jgi:hypothetical protein
VVPYTYPVHPSHDDEPEQHTAHVMTVLHPAEVPAARRRGRILEANLGRFAYLLTGPNLDLEETGLDHRVLDTLEDAEEWVAEVDADMAGWKKDKLVAWDAEWQGQHPVNGATSGPSSSPGTRRRRHCFVAHPGGKTAFRDRDGKPAVKRLVKLLNEFMADKRAVGHFLVSDLEWAHARARPDAGPGPALRPEVKTKGQGPGVGAAAGRRGLARHGVHEPRDRGDGAAGARNAGHAVHDLPPVRHPAGRLEEGVLQGARHQAEALEGYGDCPDKILIPYANYDADVTLRIAKELLPCSTGLRGQLLLGAVLGVDDHPEGDPEIHQNGIVVDRKRIDDLTRKFITAKAAQEEEIREWAKWPEFNVRSVQQVKEFLFGEKLNGKRDETGGRSASGRRGPVAVRHPLLDTSKPPRRWRTWSRRGSTRTPARGPGR